MIDRLSPFQKDQRLGAFALMLDCPNLGAVRQCPFGDDDIVCSVFTEEETASHAVLGAETKV